MQNVVSECYANLPPLFTMDMNNVVISENTPVGTSIYTLKGNDPEDSPVHYDLQGTDVLEVDHMTGEVTVVKPLDYEAPYTIVINEDTPPNTRVFSDIGVTDKDTSGANIEVECINTSEYQDACEIFNIETLGSEQNSYLGAIVLKRKLNYADRQEYEFLLKATDGELSSTATVSVKVGDVQDTPPYFIGNVTAEVDEDAPINTLIMTVHAEDGDRGIPRKIEYELVNSKYAPSILIFQRVEQMFVTVFIQYYRSMYKDPMNYFLLDAVTGELRTARPLDKEAIDNPEGILKLNIRTFLLTGSRNCGRSVGSDPLTVTSTEAIVKIGDVNDEPPTFDKREYFVEIPENIQEGSALPGLDMTVKDPDEGDNSAFSLELNDISGVFLIEPKTATGSTPVTIRVGNSSLDYEDPNQRKFIILVVAKELYTEKKLSSTATITVSVVDVNDNAPSFDQESYSATISEMATPGTLVHTIVAKDRDSGRTGTITVAFCQHPGKSDCLDFETKSEYQLQFIATDDDGTGQTSTVPLKVSLIDNNDNPPVFSQSIYRAFVNEGTVKFNPDLSVEAIDADKTSHVTYSIIAGNEENLFSIDANLGRIRIKNNKGLNVRNDTDNVITLTVMASDTKYTATAIVNITILDINNNPPVFNKATYESYLLEDVPIGTPVDRVEATDADNGVNAEFEYFIQKGAYEDFRIDNTTGIVSVFSKLDFDRRNTYNMDIIAVDHGTPSLTGTTTLIVNVVNTNDKLPYFVPTTQTADVMEDAVVGTIIHSLVALDPDVNSTDALNFAATEPITALDKHGNEVTGNDVFKEFFYINKNTGKVSVMNPLQRDVAATVRITVLVTDITAPTVQQGEGLLVITIGDVNDSPPMFLPPWTVEKPIYYLELKEEQPVGTIVVTYNALDEDSDIAGYAIIPENEFFQINNVKIVNLNDNDPIFSEREYNASIDENSPNGTIILSVKATDLDADEYGDITYALTGEHSENFGIHNKTVNATDQDSGINGNVHYNIISGNDNDIFILGIETGILYPHKSLLGQTRDFRLVVEARDGGGNGRLSDKATINVHVLNVNEHKPEFIMPSLSNATIEVLENEAVENYLIMTVKAKDKDEAENGRITYHFKVDELNVQETAEFKIDQTSGELRTKQTLDRETIAKYGLVLVARDHGTPKWYETIRHLTVLLVDENDNRPEFPGSKSTNPYHFYVTENNEENILLGRVKALDRDEGKHAKVYYYVLTGNEDDSFHLDRSDGGLYAKKSFDREQKAEYNLLVIANNDPTFHLTPEQISQMNEEELMHSRSVATVIVTINDLNDNSPTFEQNAYYSAVNAMANINDFVTNVTASDPDLGLNGSLTYYIKASNLYKFNSNRSSGSIIPSPFNISDRGEIYTATYLAENNQHRFVVDIIARENAFPEREAYAQVYVWIFEPEQLIRVILSRPREEVVKERNEIVAELSNATQSLVIIDEIRFHIDDNGQRNDEWSDIYIIVVNPKTQTIVPVPEVLKIIDSKYDFLKDYYAGFAIENVVPAFITEERDVFDPALAALIAIMIVIFVGVITLAVVCCCLRHWVISPSDLKKKDALIKKAIIDDLNTTENPLWIEQKLKIYEEQELTMQVFNEPEQNALGRRGSDDYVPEDNTYATIQHPNRRASSHLATMSLADDLADYATLSGVAHRQPGSNNSSLREAPNYYEAAMGFQGSTFQVPERLSTTSDYDAYRARFKGSELTINHEGQPEYVAELI
ncbi:hypothetical protein NQ317_003207 [Molorchus minor]|uniref:Cadherin domain-containing protein n=1 Tax=Molorchus minor TaxID=1323400 RepID=A0ABQ9J897_9CUCU|nr:hypothetical protein NQ317_003207 [Molorchus minor]